MEKTANKRLVFIDTETGGVIPEKHSLLSIGLVIWDADQGIIGKQEYFIKSARYVVTQEAKRINKFKRLHHNMIAEDAASVINKMIDYCQSFFPDNIAIPLAGHNIQFDVGFLKVLFKKNNRSFGQYFSHRMIDTYSVYKTIVLSGVIEENIDSSANAFSYFNIRVDERHDALSDCIATVELYEKLIRLIQK